MSQNIYDNEPFFSLYKKLRDNKNSANNLEERPERLLMLPDIRGKKVLDLGCGYGEDCLTYSEMGAKSVKGIDISKKMLEVAKTTCNNCENVSFECIDMEKIYSLNEMFDIIVSSLAIHYIKDFDNLCNSVMKLLNKGGYFLFSQEHPIFTAPQNGVTWQTDIGGRIKGMVVEDYPISGKRETYWLVDNVIKYHRTFSDIVNALIRSGFSLKEIKEPTVTDEVIAKSPNLFRCKHVPDYLFVLARKE